MENKMEYITNNQRHITHAEAQKLEEHILSQKYMRMYNESEFYALVHNSNDGIKAIGQLVPAILYKGKIFDGRNRRRASVELGIDLLVVDLIGDYTEDELTIYAKSLSGGKRHLTMSELAFKTAREFINDTLIYQVKIDGLSGLSRREIAEAKKNIVKPSFAKISRENAVSVNSAKKAKYILDYGGKAHILRAEFHNSQLSRVASEIADELLTMNKTMDKDLSQYVQEDEDLYRESVMPVDRWIFDVYRLKYPKAEPEFIAEQVLFLGTLPAIYHPSNSDKYKEFKYEVINEELNEPVINPKKTKLARNLNET